MMKKILFCLILLLGSIASIAGASDQPVVIIELNSAISPASDDFLKTSLATAEQMEARLFVIKLNTPGGLLQSMQTMVEQLLQAKVPTVVYVSPSGGGAVSAGVFVTMAGNFAAMAPGTTIGAATPVQGTGQDIEGTMKAKVENFAVSLIKAISEQRGRNIEWAEKAVREAQSITDREALEKKVVDIIARDLDDLLGQLEGRTAKVEGKEVKLQGLKEARREIIDRSFKQKILNVLTDPNILILLGLGALLGLGIEFYHPGLILPGLIGLICLVLALTAAAVLPINYGGVTLLILAVGFFIAEAFAPTFGLFGAAGIICLILGSIYLIDTDMVWSVQGFTVDKFMVGSVAALVGLILVVVSVAVVQALQRKVVTGQEGMIGKIAVVKSGFGTGERLGKVTVMGELWKARIDVDAVQEIPPGTKVTVLAVEDGLQLLVKVGE